MGETLNYDQGDILNCSAYSGKNKTIIADSPTTTKVYSVEFHECIDPDNNSYPIVKIGTQWWMAENLKTTKYNDGCTIPNVTDNSAWAALTTGAYCWNNNDINNKNIYGALFNWYAVKTGKLCPIGWHVNSDAEWTTLSTFLGGIYVAGGKMKETGTTHWQSPNKGATNESGFSGLPGGSRYDSGFGYVGSNGGWWSSTEGSSDDAWKRGLTCWDTYVNRISGSKNYGFSVRCVRDN